MHYIHLGGAITLGYNVNKGILIYPDQTQFYGNNLHCLEKSDLVAYVTDQGAVVD